MNLEIQFLEQMIEQQTELNKKMDVMIADANKLANELAILKNGMSVGKRR